MRRAVWSALGVALVIVAWGCAARVYGPLVLPSPLAAARELVRLTAEGTAGRALTATAVQALGGFGLGSLVGLLAGFLAAAVEPAALTLSPIATLLIGVPPVAWLILALLWFGPDGWAPAFTVAVTVAPLAFGGALHGLISRDAALDELSRAFRAPLKQRLTDILAPQLAAHLAPALASALGFSWKVCVMAEVMASGSGIGGELALARAHLDLDRAMAWVLMILLLVLAGDAALIAPLRRWARRLSDFHVAG